MANLRGPSRLLPEIATVCTEKQFIDLCAKDAFCLEKEYVFMSSVQVRNELCGGVRTGALPQGSIAVVPNNCSASYIAFLLNSLPCQYVLFDQKINVKATIKISKKTVSKLVAYEVDDISEKAYGVAENLREELYQIYLENKEDLKYHHLYNIISDLCNILSLELYAHPMFEEMGIFIVENWKSLVADYEKTNNLEALFDGLINSDSVLRNQIMKVHMFEDIFDNYIKTQSNGVEDK